MGNALSYFYRKKSSLEKLQDICDTIKNIEEYHFNVTRRRKSTENFLFYTMMVLIIFGCCYLYFFPRSLKDSRMIWVSLVMLSTLLIFLRRIVSWYFDWKIRKNRTKRNDAIAAKDKIIKNVMETETYNVAKTILEQYAPHLRPQLQMAPVPLAGSELRRRVPNNQSTMDIRPVQPPQQLQRQYKPPANIEPKSMINRFVEVMLGDGPSNRYALICQNCHEHNGLVLREEFEFTSYRCPKCSVFHPARKQRPSAPKLADFTVADREMNESSDVTHEPEAVEEANSEEDAPASDEPTEIKAEESGG